MYMDTFTVGAESPGSLSRAQTGGFLTDCYCWLVRFVDGFSAFLPTAALDLWLYYCFLPKYPSYAHSPVP